VSAVDARLERFRPALVYDPQEPYRAIAANSITDWPGNTLQRRDGTVLARSGHGLTLDLLTRYESRDGDRMDEAGDPLPAARRFQADPVYAERVYGRVVPKDGKAWLQYWLWSYYNPKHLLGLGRHEGDWEVVQLRLSEGGEPEVATYSQHQAGEAREWDDVERLEGDHPVVYIAPLSHACYFEAGAHPYLIGIDNPDGSQAPVLPRVEAFGPWTSWIGRWGASTGVLGGRFGGRLGGQSPASPGRQGYKWTDPEGWHTRARIAAPIKQGGRAVRVAGTATYPKLLSLGARRDGGRIEVDWAIDPAPQRRATQLLVTVHRGDRVLLSQPVPIDGTAGTVEVTLTEAVEGELIVRGSVYNALRQRSDPLETVAA
jgi:Vacuolar protein sorting-associated protein 62